MRLLYIKMKGVVFMFGHSEDKIEKLVEKKHWDKLQSKYLNGSDDQRLELAKACGGSDADESCNILVTLLHDENEAVQMEAVKSLGKIGNDHTTAQLQWLLSQQKKKKTELIHEIHQAIASVKHKQ